MGKKTKATQAGPPKGWIVSPLADSLVFIGAPLVCMAVFLPARSYFSSREIAVFLLAFFTFGHHFPGFVRAYGDRELFERFKLRFLLAPPILFGAALLFRGQGLHGLLIFLSAWDIWHVLMQHYGFMRIYDAKQGIVEPLVARLDWAVSLSWYITLILASPHYLHDLLRTAYLTGVPILSAEAIGGLRWVAIVWSSGLSLFYLGYHFNRHRQGLAVSWRKLIMLTIFLSATFYLYVYLNDFLVGFTVWSAFHCIQYYGIVWVYNRSRVDGKSPLTRFVTFLFRPKTGLLLLYLGLIMAYGSLNYWTGFITSVTLQQLMLAFVFTSNALHYYYDGFIWKVREPDTQKHLAIDGKMAKRSLPRFDSGVIQATAGVVVVLVLLGLELTRPMDELQASQSLVAAAPDVGEAHFRLAIAQLDRSMDEQALASYENALALLPDSWSVRNDLAALLVKRGDYQRAEKLLREATDLLADDQPRTNMGSWSALSASLQASDREIQGRTGGPIAVFINLADLLALQGDHEGSLVELDRALQWDPDSVRALTNRGTALAELGRFSEAAAELEQALTIDPDYSYAHYNLGSLRARFGDLQRARLHFLAAARSDDPAQRQAASQALRRLEASMR